jgi:hypothetical protein
MRFSAYSCGTQISGRADSMTMPSSSRSSRARVDGRFSGIALAAGKFPTAGEVFSGRTLREQDAAPRPAGRRRRRGRARRSRRASVSSGELAVALFVLLAGTARARVVATDLRLVTLRGR